MKSPKSIFILHRANLSWLNLEIIKFMKSTYDTEFNVLTTEKYYKDYNKSLHENNILIYEKLKEKAFNYNQDDLKTFEYAYKNEQYFKFTYLRDCIMQDREYSLSFLEIFKFHIFNKKNPENYENLVGAINYYINFFKEFLKHKKVDLIVSRPDNLIGYVLSVIAKKYKIPYTVQLTLREKNYMFWSEGPYNKDNYIKEVATKLIKKKLSDRDIGQVGGQAIPYRKLLIKDLSFLSLVRNLTIAFLDRIVFFLKNKKRDVTFFKIIMRYLRYYYFGKILKKFSCTLEEIEHFNFIYFPLPTEPEYINHSLIKEFNNVYAIIQQISQCMPAGYKLVLKEHIVNIGNKKLDYYKSLKKLPNVIFADYLISGPELLKYSKSVITVAGTSAIEAGELGKNVVLLADTVEYNFLPNIIKVKDIKKMPEYLNKSIAKVSKIEVENIKKWTLAYKHAMRSIGYYVPNSKLFQGSSNVIKKNDLIKATKELINQWQYQKKNS